MGASFCKFNHFSRLSQILIYLFSVACAINKKAEVFRASALYLISLRHSCRRHYKETTTCLRHSCRRLYKETTCLRQECRRLLRYIAEDSEKALRYFFCCQFSIRIGRYEHPRRSVQTSASVDTSIRVGRCRHPRRSMQTSASVDAE